MAVPATDDRPADEPQEPAPGAAVHAQHYLRCNYLFASDRGGRPLPDDVPGVLPPADLARYVAGCPPGLHLSLRLGRTPGRRDPAFLGAALACRPDFVDWEFGEGDGRDEVERVVSALGGVPEVAALFADGRITSDRLDWLAPLARDRYRRGLSFGAFGMPPEAFRDLVDALRLQTERFKTALVCAAVARGR